LSELALLLLRRANLGGHSTLQRAPVQACTHTFRWMFCAAAAHSIHLLRQQTAASVGGIGMQQALLPIMQQAFSSRATAPPLATSGAAARPTPQPARGLVVAGAAGAGSARGYSSRAARASSSSLLMDSLSGGAPAHVVHHQAPPTARLVRVRCVCMCVSAPCVRGVCMHAAVRTSWSTPASQSRTRPPPSLHQHVQHLVAAAAHQRRLLSTTRATSDAAAAAPSATTSGEAQAGGQQQQQQQQGEQGEGTTSASTSSSGGGAEGAEGAGAAEAAAPAAASSSTPSSTSNGAGGDPG